MPLDYEKYYRIETARKAMQILADNCPFNYLGLPITVWQTEPGAEPEVFFGEVGKATKTYYKLNDNWLNRIRSVQQEDRQEFLNWFSHLYSYMVLLKSGGKLETTNQQEESENGGWVKVRKENRMVEVYYENRLPEFPVESFSKCWTSVAGTDILQNAAYRLTALRHSDAEDTAKCREGSMEEG